MKIVVDARTMGSRPSGIGMYLFDFLKQLIQYKEFTFILLSDVAESEYIEYFAERGLEVRTQGKRVYKSVGVYFYFRYIQEQLDELKPDMFWEVNTIIPVTLKGNHKTMITVHDMFPITHMKYFGRVYNQYFKRNLKKTLKRTDLILYNSRQTKITAEKLFPAAKNIKNTVAYIISNPLTQKLPVSNQEYFLYVGNMEKRKGVDLLLKGYLEYRRQGGNKKLCLAGKMQETDINELLQNISREIDGIEYMGYISHDKKQELYANCGCFVFPSKAEGFGMPILEVMKYEKPILASNLDIYKELIGNCVNIFDIHTDETNQIANLADALFSYSDKVNAEAYKSALERYFPEKLGRIVRGFINSFS